MDLSKFKVEESTDIALVNQVDEVIFSNILDKIRICMMELGISLEGKSVYYQRNADRTSILAIKLCNGSDSDTTNFMFNGCDAREFYKYASCDVFLHADGKISGRAVNVANRISNDIVEFFNTIEGELVLKELYDSEFFVSIPLERNKDKSSKRGRLLSLVKNIFNNK